METKPTLDQATKSARLALTEAIKLIEHAADLAKDSYRDLKEYEGSDTQPARELVLVLEEFAKTAGDCIWFGNSFLSGDYLKPVKEA